jgi:allantoate deiminase
VLLSPGSVADTLTALAAIGADPAGGTTRLAWSAELFAAYGWASERIRGLGLEVEVDAAGNLIGRWQAGAGKAVLVGSHLDTVPRAGALDGALGVVGAIHAVEALQRDGFAPARPVWIAAFMDEEGTRFGASLFGSRAFAGGDVRSDGGRRDDGGTTLAEAMQERGFDVGRAGAAARVADVHAYLELHIEQGPVLEARARDVGVVTAIVGQRGYRLRLLGQANHAGTTPMLLRRDAFAGAARIALELRSYARAHEGVTANVGKVAVLPGASNVVPGAAEITIDLRGTDAGAMQELASMLEELVAAVSIEEGLTAELEQSSAADPVGLDPALIDLLDRAAAADGATALHLPSGAGHDAMVLARHVPAGMLFVPSRGGISHSPDEHTEPEQLERGVRVLAAALAELAGQAGTAVTRTSSR